MAGFYFIILTPVIVTSPRAKPESRITHSIQHRGNDVTHGVNSGLSTGGASVAMLLHPTELEGEQE